MSKQIDTKNSLNMLTHPKPHSHTNTNALSEHIIQINSLRMPSLRSLREEMHSFGMGSFLQAFPNGTFSETCQP